MLKHFSHQPDTPYYAVKNYIYIARIDHWFKNIFMLPGIALALILTHIPVSEAIVPSIIAILSTCLVSSANYVINEWLDKEFDRHHPIKKDRPSAVGNIQGKYVYLEYILLISIGLGLASLLNKEFLMFSIALLIMGGLYNVKPFRTKDLVYLDVLSESVNNPLRLLLGWSALVSSIFPPSSILLAYWMGGAFLMAMKRYAEFRYIDDHKQAGFYRRSFVNYTEQSLLLSSFFYAISSAFFLGVFLIKYRVEFLLSFPFFALLFVWYAYIAMKPQSVSQTPEKLYQEPKFITYVVFLGVIVTILFFVDIPWMASMVEPVAF